MFNSLLFARFSNIFPGAWTCVISRTHSENSGLGSAVSLSKNDWYMDACKTFGRDKHCALLWTALFIVVTIWFKRTKKTRLKKESLHALYKNGNPFLKVKKIRRGRKGAVAENWTQYSRRNASMLCFILWKIEFATMDVIMVSAFCLLSHHSPALLSWWKSTWWFWLKNAFMV